MKVVPITRRLREEAPAQKQLELVRDLDSRKAVVVRKRKITPISKEVMEYYENLLKEHNQYGARHSKLEYRIF